MGRRNVGRGLGHWECVFVGDSGGVTGSGETPDTAKSQFHR